MGRSDHSTAEAIEMFVVEPPTSAWADPAGFTDPMIGPDGHTSPDDAASADESNGERETTEDPSLANRSGTGAWPNGDRAVRTGNCEEVLVTMAADRLEPLSVLDPNALFQPRLRRFDVDPASMRRSHNELAWDGELRTLVGVRRKASLRIYRSPSGNVTVLTLVPLTASRFFPTAFIRPGLRSMRDLRDRIDALT